MTAFNKTPSYDIVNYSLDQQLSVKGDRKDVNSISNFFKIIHIIASFL